MLQTVHNYVVVWFRDELFKYDNVVTAVGKPDYPVLYAILLHNKIFQHTKFQADITKRSRHKFCMKNSKGQ